MSRRLLPFLVFVGIVVGFGGVSAGLFPPALVADPAYTVVASGLDNPRGLDFGPDGALYVAEAGVGGDGACIPGPVGTPICYGATGAITRVFEGEQRRVIDGLPSLAGGGGFFSFGPHDVDVRGRNGVIAMGLDATVADRASLGADGQRFAQLLGFRYNNKGKFRLRDLGPGSLRRGQQL